MNSVSDDSLPLGDPPLLEHPTPNGVTEIAQRLVRFPCFERARLCSSGSKASQHLSGNRNLSASSDVEQRDVRKNGGPVSSRCDQKIQQQEIWKKSCQVQGRHYGGVRPRLFLRVTAVGPPC